MSTDTYFDFTPANKTWPDGRESTHPVAYLGWLVQDSNFDRWEKFCTTWGDHVVEQANIGHMVLEWLDMYTDATMALPLEARVAKSIALLQPLTLPLDRDHARTFMHGPKQIRHILEENVGKKLYIRVD